MTWLWRGVAAEVVESGRTYRCIQCEMWPKRRTAVTLEWRPEQLGRRCFTVETDQAGQGWGVWASCGGKINRGASVSSPLREDASGRSCGHGSRFRWKL